MKEIFFRHRYLIIANVIVWFLYLVLTLPFALGVFKELEYPKIALLSNIITVLFLFIVNYQYLTPYFLKNNKYTKWILAMFALIIITVLFRTYLDTFYYLGTLFGGKPFPQVNLRLANFSMVVMVSSVIKFLEINELRNKQELLRENRQLEAELGFLKSQINPHFLFNTLNNIYSFTYLKDDRAPAMLTKLSEIMRYMLYECREKRVPLIKELELIKSYLNLEQLKNDNREIVDFYSTGVQNQHKIAPLILITFVENCFKHGDIGKSERAWINIVIEVDENSILSAEIGNSKQSSSIPKNKKTKQESSGLGIENAKQQLLLNYPERHEIDFEENENSYIVRLKISL
jgi:two-component system, LytTR family, sensor kinase